MKSAPSVNTEYMVAITREDAKTDGWLSEGYSMLSPLPNSLKKILLLQAQDLPLAY